MNNKSIENDDDIEKPNKVVDISIIKYRNDRNESSIIKNKDISDLDKMIIAKNNKNTNNTNNKTDTSKLSRTNTKSKLKSESFSISSEEDTSISSLVKNQDILIIKENSCKASNKHNNNIKDNKDNINNDFSYEPISDNSNQFTSNSDKENNIFDSSILFSTIKKEYKNLKPLIDQYIIKDNFLSLIKTLIKRLSTEQDYNLLSNHLIDFSFKYSGYQSTFEIIDEININLNKFEEIIPTFYEKKELKNAISITNFIESSLDSIQRILRMFKYYIKYKKILNEKQEEILVKLYEMKINIYEVKNSYIDITDTCSKILRLKTINSSVLLLKNMANMYIMKMEGGK